MEVTRGSERGSISLEHWRRLVALHDKLAADCFLAAARSLDESRQILFPQRVTKLNDFSHFVQAWENFELKHWNALEKP